MTVAYPANIRMLGENSADNVGASDLVVGNIDGTIVERLEHLYQTLYLNPTGMLFASPRIAAKQHTSPLTTGNIFTFTGSIEIMAIWGRVTTVVQSQATTIKFSVVNDALAAYDLDTTVDGNAAAVGSLLSITGTAAGAAVITANGVLAPTQASRIITTCTTSGVIKVTYGAASTGAILYQILWRPLSTDATLIAA